MQSHLKTSPVTMTSREIADLTTKRHADVMRDIRGMFAELEIGESKFAFTYKDTQNKDRPEYRLDRDLTETLLLGYSAAARLAVIRRMREIEAALVTPRPMTTAEIVLQNAQALVDFERRQSAVELRVDMIASMTALPAKPQHCESKTEIKARINKLYGLPAWLVDEVLTSISYRPPVFAMVKRTRRAVASPSIRSSTLPSCLSASSANVPRRPPPHPRIQASMPGSN